MTNLTSFHYMRTSSFDACLRCLILFMAFAILAGCAKPSLYSWGDYGESLELRYEKENLAQAEQVLREQMAGYDAGKRVPPGVCADYGFLLYRRGDLAGAVLFFEKERNAFPESTFLMNKLIDRIKKKSSQDPAKVSEGGQQ
jgi:hypothetical protein